MRRIRARLTISSTFDWRIVLMHNLSRLPEEEEENLQPYTRGTRLWLCPARAYVARLAAPTSLYTRTSSLSGLEIRTTISVTSTGRAIVPGPSVGSVSIPDHYSHDDQLDGGQLTSSMVNGYSGNLDTPRINVGDATYLEFNVSSGCRTRRPRGGCVRRI
jgi:hypothetical protein